MQNGVKKYEVYVEIIGSLLQELSHLIFETALTIREAKSSQLLDQ
jgi:hypothetical protein